MTISPVVRSVLRTAGITFAGAFLSALSITKMPHSWSDLWADVAPAMFAALIAEVAYLRSVFAVKPDAVAKAASKVSMLFVLVFGAATMSGCLAAPTVQVTPQNASQISTCQTNANVHNAAWVAAGILGASAAGLGTGGTLTDDVNTQHALAGTSIGVGVAAVGMAALEALTASNYNAASCGTLVTPLQSMDGR